MNEKYIQKIGNLSACENLQVLYLHNNDITKITNLEPLVTLKHLYLQKNKLKKIEGLSNLKQLKKLYLGCNEISVIEGLENLQNLEELHIEKQRLTKGESLCFDPRSIINLIETLHTLNISHNNLTTISDLETLKKLKFLDASHNKLTDVQEIAKVVHNWFYITELNFTGNPMSKQHRYRDTIIANTFRLVILDKKEINETTRSFIKRFEYEQSQNRMNSAIVMNIPRNIPGHIAPQLEKTISKNLLGTSVSPTLFPMALSEETDTYLPWKALKPCVRHSGKVIPPLFAKHDRRKKSEPKKVQFASTFPQFP
ncbi:defective transmitter release [Carabus blaptoides fortunei]